jgi:polar amino acid transport system substrate-binding protein
MKFVYSILIISFFILCSSAVYAEKAEVKAKHSSVVRKKKNNNYPPDIQKIIDRKKIIIGLYYKDKPPFIMTGKNGKLYGLDISLARDIAKYLKVEVEFNRDAKSYTELYETAVTGVTAKGNPVDVIISKFSRTYERAKGVRFSQPYLTFRQALIVNKIHVARNKIEAYPMDYLRSAKVKIGVRGKTSYVEYARDMFKNAEIVEGKWDEILSMVVNGEIMAVMRDEYEIMKLLKKDPELAIKISVYILTDRKDHIAMAVPCKSSNLLAWLDMYLDSRQKVLNAKDIIKKYPEAWK